MGETLLLATRNPHKLAEIRGLLAPCGVTLVSLVEAGVPPDPAEESLEVHDSFTGNALAKARFFRRGTGLPAIADDSGLCVDALDGSPGIRSRRFAPEPFRAGRPEDEANNAWLLERLSGVPPARRGAHYACVLALVDEGRSLVLAGRVSGRIVERERGDNGFGYDPLFEVAGLGRTFGELPPERKAELSHRADAVRRLRPWLAGRPSRADDGGPS